MRFIPTIFKNSGLLRSKAPRNDVAGVVIARPLQGPRQSRKLYFFVRKEIRALFFLFFIFSSQLSAATPADEALIRDAEIEAVLKSFIEPLFVAAKLDPKSLHLYVINSKDVNAFAMGGRAIGITTGLILKANSALQVIGVLAH